MLGLLLQEQVEPILDQYKPPIIKRIYFKNLTFGDAPFVVEDVWVEENTKEHVLLEVMLVTGNLFDAVPTCTTWA